MSENEHIIRLHSIVSRTLLQVQVGEEMLRLSRSMGVPDDAYVYFMMGLMYSSTQAIFRKESQLEEKDADEMVIKFWETEGSDIRNRLSQIVEEKNNI